MALIGGLLAAGGRFFGKIANMALGWATVLLFGHVPQTRQSLLGVIALGSIAWVVAIVGVIVPDVGVILLAAIPRPDFVPDAWIRIAMLVVVVVLPPALGAGTILLLDKGARPKGRDLLAQLLRGYPYVAALAFTLVFLALMAIVRKVRSLLERAKDTHVPVLVKPGGYDAVVTDLEDALDKAGLDVHRERAPRALALPPRLLAAAGGATVKALVPDELVELQSPDLEVLVYPSDVALLGREQAVARGRAAIAARLTFTEAYLTAAEESQRIEDRLSELARQEDVSSTDFEQLDLDLASLVIPYEEWDTLYRLRLQVENEKRPHQRQPGFEPSARAASTVTADPPRPAEWAVAGAIFALLGLDVAFAAIERIRGVSPKTSR
jgi:hypothetical protein